MEMPFDDDDEDVATAKRAFIDACHPFYSPKVLEAIDAMILVRIVQAIEFAEKRFKQKLAEDRQTP